MKITAYLSALMTLLVLSSSRILLSQIFTTMGIFLSVPPVVQTGIGVGLTTAVYILIYLFILELNPKDTKPARLMTIFIIALQSGRTVMYYSGKSDFIAILYPLFICLISAYLFLLGIMLYRGGKASWNPALLKLIRSTGIVTFSFAPLSALFYILMRNRGIGLTISLDFIFMGLWGSVSVRTLLHYLSRIGTIPLSGTADDSFIEYYGISRREKEVLQLILDGYTNREIGDRLFISLPTARTHVSHIFEKTGVGSRMELVSKIVSENAVRN